MTDLTHLCGLDDFAAFVARTLGLPDEPDVRVPPVPVRSGDQAVEIALDRLYVRARRNDWPSEDDRRAAAAFLEQQYGAGYVHWPRGLPKPPMPAGPLSARF